MAAVVLLALACAQAVYCAPSPCGCGGYGGVDILPAYGGYGGYAGGFDGYLGGFGGYGGYAGGFDGYLGGYGGYAGGYGGYAGGYGGCGVGLVEGCCPGPVVEQEYVVPRPVTVPYTYTQPTFSKQCFQTGTVARDVIPRTFETAPACETVEHVTKLPTTDITEVQEPLRKTTCTTSEYVIQIPIVETTCTNTPLCKKTLRAQDHLLTTTSRQTGCAKQICSQNQIVEQPITKTVCQNFEGAVTRTGAQTVIKPEVVSDCVQLPPYKCLKPAYEGYGYGGYGYGGAFDGVYGGYGYGGAFDGVYGGYPGYGYGGYGYDGVYGGYPGYGYGGAFDGVYGGYPGYGYGGAFDGAYGGYGYGGYGYGGAFDGVYGGYPGYFGNTGYGVGCGCY